MLAEASHPKSITKSPSHYSIIVARRHICDMLFLWLLIMAFSYNLVIVRSNTAGKPHYEALTPSTAAQVMSAMPTSLAIFATQCKCKFIGLCSCRASVEFMDCIADACASGHCDCHKNQFQEACGNMSAACPSIGVQCSKDKATCLHHSHAEDEPTADILSDLEELRQQKCKLLAAAKAGFLNADNRLRELKPRIQARIDALALKRVPCSPNMDCKDEPICVDGTLAVSAAAPSAAEPQKLETTAGKAGTDQRQEVNSEEEQEDEEEQANPATSSQKGTLSGHIGYKKKSFGMCFLHVFVHILLVLVLAFVYNQFRDKWQASNVKGQEGRENNFRFNLFGCINDPRMTLMVLCCAPLRWADTMDKANSNNKTKRIFMPYWPAILLWVILEAVCVLFWCIGYASITASVATLIAVIIGVYFRQKLRQKYRLPFANVKSYAEDVFAWFCCSCCAIIQEARQVEFDREPGFTSS